jgi:hypothetical protein
MKVAWEAAETVTRQLSLAATITYLTNAIILSRDIDLGTWDDTRHLSLSRKKTSNISMPVLASIASVELFDWTTTGG